MFIVKMELEVSLTLTGGWEELDWGTDSRFVGVELEGGCLLGEEHLVFRAFAELSFELNLLVEFEDEGFDTADMSAVEGTTSAVE